MKRFAVICSIFLGLSPTILTAQDAPDWWVGVWAYDVTWCAGQGAGPPIEITSDTLFGYENTCSISATNEITEATVHMLLKCSGEGEPYKTEYIFLRGESSLWMWLGYDEPMQFHYCN